MEMLILFQNMKNSPYEATEVNLLLIIQSITLTTAPPCRSVTQFCLRSSGVPTPPKHFIHVSAPPWFTKQQWPHYASCFAVLTPSG